MNDMNNAKNNSIKNITINLDNIPLDSIISKFPI